MKAAKSTKSVKSVKPIASVNSAFDRAMKGMSSPLGRAMARTLAVESAPAPAPAPTPAPAPASPYLSKLSAKYSDHRSMAQLKQAAKERGIVPTGDKRLKATWVNALAV